MGCVHVFMQLVSDSVCLQFTVAFWSVHVDPDESMQCSSVFNS